MTEGTTRNIDEKEKKGFRPFRFAMRLFLVLMLLVLYAISSVPVGLFLYSVKSDIGINIFSRTGFHSYMQCLREQAYKIEIDRRNAE